MSDSISNNRGLSMIEVLIALLLTMIGVMGLMSMQPQGWWLSGKSDFLGRAAGILHEELEAKSALIMNPCNNVVQSNPNIKTTFANGPVSTGAGDIQYIVQTNIVPVVPNLTWRLTIRVTPPGSPAVSESTIVTRQEAFRFPGGCVNNSVTPNYN
ncbi:MAG: prepilin-type N-terminal cleavage/methylation domain-containing protein [Nitrospirota bacterium]